MALVIACSLLAGLFFATSSVAQQRATWTAAGASTVHGTGERGSLLDRLPVLRLLQSLARNRLWVLGWFVNFGGFCAQAAALHAGSVAIVQPILVTELLFTLILVSFADRTRPYRTETLGGLLIAAGVVVFLIARGGVDDDAPVHRGLVLLATIAGAAAVGILVIASTGRSPLAHSAGIAAAAGLCFAISAVLIKLTAIDLFDHGVRTAATDWTGYTLAVTSVTGALLEQEAFRSGPLSITLSVVTITNPVASYAIGVLAFEVSIPTDAGTLAQLTGAAAAMTAGSVLLARGAGRRLTNAIA
jgi:drug/metabolite transporter (DMT)-like permease